MQVLYKVKSEMFVELDCQLTFSHIHSYSAKWPSIGTQLLNRLFYHFSSKYEAMEIWIFFTNETVLTFLECLHLLLLLLKNAFNRRRLQTHQQANTHARTHTLKKGRVSEVGGIEQYLSYTVMESKYNNKKFEKQSLL